MKRERRATPVVLLCLFLGISISAAAQTADFSISPSQFYVYDSEVFISLRGVSVGSDSTIVTYTNGVSRFDVPAQVDLANPSSILESWVPIAVTVTSGDWSVSVVATDTGGAQRIYGPVTLSVIDRPVVDGPPVIPLPEVLVIEADDASGGVGNYDDGGASCDHPPGSHFPMGSTTVNCTASNSFGTTNQSFLVFVTDTTLPTITVPSDITTTEHVINFTATASDNIDGAITPHCTPASGSTFSDGETIVQCVATDAHGNQAFGSFKVDINFVPPPLLNLPGNFNAEATGPSGANVTFAASASDVNGAVPVVCSPASGSSFAFGVTEVDCAATGVGGTTSGSFFVTVVDTTPPRLTLPSPVVEATGPSGAVVNYTATATDLVDGSVPVICAPASGGVFALGQTTVACTATDSHLNQARGTFTVTVRDTTPPQILSIDGSPREIIWPPNHKLIPIQVIVVATDAVDPAPHARIIGVTSDQPDNCNCGDGDTPNDISITGDLAVSLRAERTGGIDRHYTITVEVTDFSGNASRGTLVIAVHP